MYAIRISALVEHNIVYNYFFSIPLYTKTSVTFNLLFILQRIYIVYFIKIDLLLV